MTQSGPASSGRLIVFEGPDGVGKSTIHAGILERLEAVGEQATGLSFPGRRRGSLGDLVYRVHHGEISDVDPFALQMLHVAAHIDAIRGPITEAIESDRIVLLHRFWWSTWVYGTVSGLPPEGMDDLIALELQVWDGLAPSLLVLIGRDRPFRKEHEPTYHHKLTRAYEELAACASHPVVHINNHSDLGTVMQQTFESVEEVLAGSQE